MLSRASLLKVGSLFDVLSTVGGPPESALARLAQCAGRVTLASALVLTRGPEKPTVLRRQIQKVVELEPQGFRAPVGLGCC